MNILKSQSGQGVVEMVLLTVLSVSLILFVQKSLQENQFAQKIFGKPWATLSGMIECGVWEPCAPGLHPNNRSRVNSTRPDQ